MHVADNAWLGHVGSFPLGCTPLPRHLNQVKQPQKSRPKHRVPEASFIPLSALAQPQINLLETLQIGVTALSHGTLKTAD